MNPITRKYSLISILATPRQKQASSTAYPSDSDANTFGKERKQMLKKYMCQGNGFSPVGEIETVATLEPGIYRAVSTMDGPRFEVHSMKTDELIPFEDPRYNQVISEINDFWGLKERFAKYGFAHKRGILLYGEPGTGKSCLLKQVMDSSIRQGHVVLICKSPSDLVNCVKAFREVEKERKALVILEDVDELCHWDEHSILQLFDGDAQTDNILYLATTNYIDRLPSRMLRANRFDRKVEIGTPPIQGRYAYLSHKLSATESDEDIKRLAQKSDGFSFAQLRELVVARFCLGQSENDSLNRIRSNVESAPRR